jgi:hypothetical protein
MTIQSPFYAARLDIDYPQKIDRLTTLVRPILIIPIVVILSLLPSGGGISFQIGEHTGNSVGGVGGIAATTALMIVFKQRYPRWWFDFARELVRFSARIGPRPLEWCKTLGPIPLIRV